MVTLNGKEELTLEVLKKIIDNHNSSEDGLTRLEKLERYYKNKNDINNRSVNDTTKPNNKVSNAYASYITDTLTGYFLGEPVSYNSEDKDLLEKLGGILEYNDEADENMELAKDASIYGVAYEYLYMSEIDKQLRIKRLDPKQTIPVYDKTVEQNLIAVIRYYEDYNYIEDKTYTIVEVIDDANVTSYQRPQFGGSFTLIGSYSHYFGMVPVAIYENNEEQMGDFEKVIPLIDAYDKMESDTLNDFEYFTDAYLALYGFTAEPEDIRNMKENRVLLMDEGTSAEWLIKNSGDNTTEDTKDRLDKDIHKFSKCPDMSDENFAGNASGVAIQFKMLGTENLVSIKERKFKRGLQQRLELISMISSLLGSQFDWRTIDIIFTRNLPNNMTELAQMVNTLSGIVSEETLLAQLPFVEDVQAELEKVKKEKEENKKDNPFFQTPESDLYQTGAMNEEDEKEEEDE